MTCRNPIIIGGAGSSGSTLLVSILNRHKEIAAGPELSLLNKRYFFETPYTKIQENLKRILRKGICTDGWFIYPRFFFSKYGFSDQQVSKLFDEATSQKEFIDGFFGKFLEREKKKIWAEKTPSNAYCFKNILELYPEARLIHIYRDGRDVVTSFIKRGMSPYYACMLWIYNTAQALTFRGHPNYYEMSYESLVNDPAGEINKLCAFLDVPFSDELLRADKDQKVELASWNHSPNQGIVSSSVGKYVNFLQAFHYFTMQRSEISMKHRKNYELGQGTFDEVQRALGYESISGFPKNCSFLTRFVYSIRLVILLLNDLIYRYFMLAKSRYSFPPYPGRIVFKKQTKD